MLKNSKPQTISTTKHRKHNFMAFSLVPQVKWNKTSLAEKLSCFVDGLFGEVIRAKGHVASENGMLEFNYVNGTYEIIQITQEIEPAVCFIGEGLDKVSISELFGISSL